MLKSISWQEFILTTAVLIGCYYTITTLLLYSDEIITIFKHKKLKFARPWTQKSQTDTTHSNDLLGGVKYEFPERQNAIREEDVNSESIIVAPLKEVEEAISVSVEETPNEKLRLTISDLCNEIKSLIEITSSGNRAECITLFQTLLSNYPQLVGTKDQEIIDKIIYNEWKSHCEFSIELNEIHSWWPQPETLSNNK